MYHNKMTKLIIIRKSVTAHPDSFRQPCRRNINVLVETELVQLVFHMYLLIGD